MKKFTILMLTGLAFAATSAQAVRVIEVIERSYELALADVSTPQRTSGTIGFKPCSNCARAYMPVNGATTYYVDGQMVTLAQFNAEVNRIRQVSRTEARTILVLHYDPESEIATRIRVETL